MSNRYQQQQRHAAAATTRYQQQAHPPQAQPQQQAHPPQQQQQQQPQHPERSQSRGVAAQLPQLQPTHREAPRRQQSGGRGEDNEEAARGRGRPRQARPEPVSDQQVGLSQEQRDQIQRYLELDDQIKRINDQLKGMRAQRKQLEDEVLAIVRPLRSGALETGNNVLRAKKTKKKQGLNQQVWAEKLAASGQLRDPNNAPALVKHVYKSLTVTEDYELERVIKE